MAKGWKCASFYCHNARSMLLADFEFDRGDWLWPPTERLLVRYHRWHLSPRILPLGSVSIDKKSSIFLLAVHLARSMIAPLVNRWSSIANSKSNAIAANGYGAKFAVRTREHLLYKFAARKSRLVVARKPRGLDVNNALDSNGARCYHQKLSHAIRHLSRLELNDNSIKIYDNIIKSYLI